MWFGGFNAFFRFPLLPHDKGSVPQFRVGIMLFHVFFAAYGSIHGDGFHDNPGVADYVFEYIKDCFLRVRRIVCKKKSWMTLTPSPSSSAVNRIGFVKEAEGLFR